MPILHAKLVQLIFLEERGMLSGMLAEAQVIRFAGSHFSGGWPRLIVSKVLDTILLLFSALVAREPRDLPELVDKSDFVQTLFDMLGTLNKNNDPLWLISCGLNDIELKRAGLVRVDKSLVSRRCFQTQTSLLNIVH